MVGNFNLKQEESIKVDVKKITRKCAKLTRVAQSNVEYLVKHSNEPFAFWRVGKHLDTLSDCQLPKNYSVL
jgi:hypothetical protein